EPNKVEYLTVSDELELLTFYLSKISQLCRASFFKFPETVEATAMTYLKRFYLRNTCMDYHPKNIMLTCLFLATKTENVSISIDNFASRIPKTTNDDVLSLEFLVAQSLRFQFKVHHPHLAARGIYLDLQQCFLEAMDLNLLSNSWSKVSSLLRSARLTDLEFLWAPSQIAAAAWWAVDKTLTENWLLKKSDRKNLSQLPSLSIESLTSHLSSISKVFLRAQEAPINKDRVTAVDRRLRFCRNPEKDPNSSLYKLKQAEIENESLSKHREKYSKEKAQDPFA
ncbi:cyclin-like protein, partial [Phakopsora pachyrhizi]